MRSVPAAVLLCVLAASAAAAECPGSPDAVGTARTIVVDPSEHTRIGTMQYAETLPLGPKEVVLTFDDGPIPPYSDRILDILSAECVKATFFIVGRQARAFPERVQRAYREGHTIATHSQNHPRMFQRLPTEKAIAEIEEGFASAGAALGDRQAVAPFFRVPGLGTSAATEAYLAAHDVMVWSADFPADDWRHISAKQVKQRALDRLEAKGQGVLLLHDIQPATVLALPDLLREFKARGYSIVHVAAVGAERPKTATTPEQWRPRAAERQVWPRAVEMPRQAPRETKPEAAQLPAPSRQSDGWPDVFALDLLATTPLRLKLARRGGWQTVRIAAARWPGNVAAVPVIASDPLGAPSLASFGVSSPLGPSLALSSPLQAASHETAAAATHSAPPGPLLVP
jgi:peptidoglycan/xylan/chitin deacetylase (PgdA/CDA1 family)